MLKAGVFYDFKDATTLLLWGDREGMATLSLACLRSETAVATSLLSKDAMAV